jgi:exosortase A-associated hydrolase 2
MNSSRGNRPALPFFLKTGIGERFCLYHAPAPGMECRGAFVYVHPFAEEMNKSRRMAALQARRFANAGFGVLQIDLFGCGDSSGDFGDARWDIWKADLTVARKWVEDNVGVPVSIWGLRLGALLALDFAVGSNQTLESLLLWQPVLNGESFLTQFLRMRLANAMLTRGDEKRSDTQEMRKVLAAGGSLEVAGYELAPELAASIDSMNAGRLAVRNTPLHWFELVSEPGRPLSPAAARVVSDWEQQGVDLHVHLVSAPPFWASQEISECPSLLTATTSLLDEVLL